MPGSAHEVLLASIHDRPEILAALVFKLRGASLPPGLAPVDSNIRFVEPAEIAILKEQTMNLSQIPERPAVRELRLLLEGQARAQGEAQGKAEGMREALLAMLEVRGLAVSNGERASIETCTDVAQLRQWVERAVMAASTSEVLAAEPAKHPARRRRASRPKVAGA